MDYEMIEEAFVFYNIDNKYKDKCYKCIDGINNDRFSKIISTLYENEFNEISKFWDIKNINDFFWNEVNPFITNLVILCGYKYHLENIKEYCFNNEQIEIQKKRVRECFTNDLVSRNYRGIRISQMLWAIYFIRGRLIEIGRLQYEYLSDSIIKIHIPSGSKLYYEEVLNSLRLSKIEIEKIYNIKDFKYICNSWLLSDEIYELVDENSNIAKFRNLFDVKKSDDCIHDILNFVYSISECDNYEYLSEDTSLQRIIKKELLNNKIFYLGIGELKTDLLEL